ncbi:hypothetical protein CJF42_07240 [Pseudoalteromonas sp. NBT06-2]|uniref:hypothetical protein n=1 Tax=Pseudoalteromonas sp. NBT06-2 TaxID=2025950 RepID=UPI000BA7777A|nr:hypothetical protein [Pseudoalteromonas sp. NBT06-2]PAJ74998.1 hypothetical protein CJF42_07240 [Pseudoalteromonas sp. NBT06-2]
MNKKRIKKLVALSLFSFATNPVFADDLKIPNKEESPSKTIEDNETPAENTTFLKEIDFLKSITTKSTPLNKAIEVFADYAKEAVETTREDQDKIEAMANNLLKITIEMQGLDNIDDLFITNIRARLHYLIDWSYKITLIKNKKVSRDIKTKMVRMATLAAELVVAGEKNETPEKIKFRKEDFQVNFDNFSTSILKAKRFNLSIGASYSYMPDINFKLNNSIDLSTYMPANSNSEQFQSLDLHSEIVGAHNFTNEGYLSIDFTAQIPYAAVDISIPLYDEKFNTNYQVNLHDMPNSNKNLMTKSDVETNISLKYDSHIRLSLRDIYQRYWRGSAINQFDFGLGLGVTGIEIIEKIKTDVKLADDGQSFLDVTESTKIESSSKRTLTPFYWSLFTRFEVNDELEVGFDTKFYNSASTEDSHIKIDGTTMRLSLSYSF